MAVMKMGKAQVIDQYWACFADDLRMICKICSIFIENIIIYDYSGKSENNSRIY